MNMMKMLVIEGLVIASLVTTGCAISREEGKLNFGKLGEIKDALDAKKELAKKTRSDDWTWDGKASVSAPVPLVTAVSDRKPVVIVFEETEVRADNFESYTGGSMVDQAKAAL